jgi:hypothetical protein
MRNAIMKSSALAIVVLGLSAGSASATQTVVKVPFSFIVQGRTLPAGEYSVEPVDDGSSVLKIQPRHGNQKASAVFLTIPAAGHHPLGDHPSVTFTRHENQYELSAVWDSATEGREVAVR